MPPKADKLQQNIESIKSFLNRKLPEYNELTNVISKVNKIEALLSEKKLTLQIVGNEEKLIQAMFDLISKNPEFNQGYKIKYDLIPELPKEMLPTSLSILKLVKFIDDEINVIQEIILDNNQVYTVGRNPELNLVLDGNIYKGVSWQHAEIKTILDEDGVAKWHIKDLNSSNSTFVNGQKIIDRILHSGEIITIANSSYQDNFACFYFTEEMVNQDNINNAYYDVIDCDVLLLVSAYDNYQLNSIFLRTLNIEMMSKQFVVMDLDIQEDEKNLEIVISEWESWLESQNFDYKIDFFPVPLTPYYQEDYQDNLSKPMQKRLDKFIKALGNVIKRQPENILAKRLNAQLIPLITPLESILVKEDEELNQKITHFQGKLQEMTQKNWKDITKNVLGEVKEDKDKFFKQIKTDLTQAKAAILDNFSKRSLISQIQNFVDDLQPIIFKKEGQPYVKLSPKQGDINTDLNQIIIQFSTSTMENWALKEWDKILNVYGNGGLNGLLMRSNERANIIPNLFSESPFHQPSELDVKNNFLISFMGIDSDVRHKQVSMAGYIMKTIRSNLMQIMMMATLVFAILGQKVGKNEMFAQLSGVFRQFPFLLGLGVFALIFFLTTSYNQDKNLKLEEAAEKLRKEVSSYYQSLSKNLLEKVIQDMNLTLEYEANRLDNSLQNIQETYNDYIIEQEKQQISIKANLDLFKEKEKNLSKEITEFKKLIRT
ncbi:FHA domain-containing protein [Geminocystis herdmanii]|uniref:FHA domain-containing protein n=1 Tax=Geminocystis herdmanii TaxID=669359 RepID=UPI00034917BA|nr:FHA domain-containing protein [Geminocystis herdmanii]